MHMPQPPDASTGGVGPQVNKFEQVSSDGHQMSLAGGRAEAVPCLMSGAIGPGDPMYLMARILCLMFRGVRGCTVRSNAWVIV